MADPQADRCAVDKAEVAFGGLVIAGRNAAGILELVEAPLDDIAHAVEGPIHDDAHLRDLRIGITGTTLHASIVLRTLSES